MRCAAAKKDAAIKPQLVAVIGKSKENGSGHGNVSARDKAAAPVRPPFT
jgi:hypothetical protein